MELKQYEQLITDITTDKYNLAKESLQQALTYVRSQVENRVTRPFSVSLNFECSDVQANKVAEYLKAKYPSYIFALSMNLGAYKLTCTMRPEIANESSKRTISKINDLFDNLASLDGD